LFIVLDPLSSGLIENGGEPVIELMFLHHEEQLLSALTRTDSN
jgi:hypothetical protein